MKGGTQIPATLKAALDAHTKGDHVQAERLYRSILKQMPDHHDALHLLGVLLHAKGDYSSAEALILRAVARVSNSPNMWSNLAMVQLAAGNPAQAIESVGRVLALAPKHPQALYFLGQASEQLGQMAQAVSAFEAALTAQPTLSPARHALYRFVEPSARDIQWLEGMATAWPDSPDWKRDLSLAISIKIPALMKRHNFAQADILRLMAQSLDLDYAQENSRLKQSIAQALGIDCGFTKRDGIGRYLLIRPWGHGFWADVDHVLGQLLLSEMLCRTPIVFWGEASRYGGSASEDAFGFFFEPIGQSGPENLPWKEATVFPPKWNAGNVSGPQVDQWEGQHSRQSAHFFFNRPEDILVSDFYTQVRVLADWLPEWHPLFGASLDDIYRVLIDRYLHPRRALIDESERQAAAMFSGRPYVAVHLRGLDKVTELHNLSAVNVDLLSKVDEILASNRELMVFGMTDDLSLLETLRQRYGQRLAVSECSRANGAVGVHFLAAGTGRRLGNEIMLDTLIARCASHFVGMGPSNVASMVGLLGQWNEGALQLHGRRPHACFVLMVNDW